MRTPRQIFTLASLLSLCACTANLHVPEAPVGIRRLAFRPAAVTTYTCAPVTVELRDATDALVRAASTTSIYLFGLGSGNAYATLADCQAQRSSVSAIFLGRGESSVEFFYRTATEEEFVLRAQANGAGSAVLRSQSLLLNVLGQPNASTNLHLQLGMFNPASVSSDGTRLFVADSSNHRVLIWNTIPTHTQQAPNVVLGQPDLYSNTANNGGISAATLSLPISVHSDGTRLFVVDRGNNRVLVWNTVPTVNMQAASFVLGQPNETTATANTTTRSGSTMSSPQTVHSDGGRLFVADTNNNRILVWNTLPTTTGQTATFAMGQTNLTNAVAATSQSGLSRPWGVYCDGNRVFVTDLQNNRVLIWTTVPTTFGQNPTVVLGQSGFNAGLPNAGGLSGSSLDGPQRILSDGTRLFIADRNNHRVLVWNSIPAANTPANFALGQPNTSSNTMNNGGLSAATLSGPSSIYILGTRLFIGDQDNQRILVWDTLPTNRSPASYVLGQVNLNSKTVNSAGIFSGPNYPTALSGDGTRLIGVDQSNHRILIWNRLPQINDEPASFALGQPDLNTAVENYGGLSAPGFSTPAHAYTDGTHLLVADTSNHRVLIWNSIPSSNRPADLVLGQPDFNFNTVNNGGVSASGMSSPKYVYSDGSRIFVSDSVNNRVLIWTSWPTANGQAASVVLGQPSFSANASNNGGISASSMWGPQGILVSGNRLFVADYNNSRVLVWNTLPTTTQAASFVLGQPNVNSNTSNNGGISAVSLNWPCDLAVFGTRLFITDYGNNRILVWNNIPTNNQPADFVLGQPIFATNNANNGGLSAMSLRSPSGIYTDGTRLFVADQGNRRTLIFDLP